MRTAVVDASVVVKWFRANDEAHRPAALAFRDAFEDGALILAAPPLLFLEILNVFGRRWSWPKDVLASLAIELDDLAFALSSPPLAGVAAWVSRGLSAYDGAYIALAEDLRVPLVTADERLLALAPDVAVHVAQALNG